MTNPISTQDIERLAFLDARITKKPPQDVLSDIHKNLTNAKINDSDPNQKQSSEFSNQFNQFDEKKRQQSMKFIEENPLNPIPEIPYEIDRQNFEGFPNRNCNSQQILKTPPKFRKTSKNIENLLKLHLKDRKDGDCKKLEKKSIKYKYKQNSEYSLDSLNSKQVMDSSGYLNLISEKDQNIKELKNQWKIQQMVSTQLQEELDLNKIYQSKCKDTIKQMVIHNELLKKQQLKNELEKNKYNLGQYVLTRDKTQLKEVWIDSQEINQLKTQLQQFDSHKKELEKQRKLYKSNYEEYIIIGQLLFLTKQEQEIQVKLEQLEIEKLIFQRNIKKVKDEEQSLYFQSPDSWPLIGNRYQILSLLGKGGFSEVYKAYDLLELKEVACKIHQLNASWSLSQKENYIKHSLREYQVQKELHHPNIVQLLDSVEINNLAFCTILEYCDGTDLSFLIKKYKYLPEQEAKLIVTQILSALKYLNSNDQKIIHYDLKPSNILFHQNQIKIVDFGLCKVLEQDQSIAELTSQGVGTYWYLPPECFQICERPPNISSKVDVWAIGCILFEMVYGLKPFGQGATQEQILKEQIILRAHNVTFPNRPYISQECKEFIKGCLKYQESQRMDVEQALQHPYISSQKLQM